MSTVPPCPGSFSSLDEWLQSLEMSTDYGFLMRCPLTRLPDEKYACWHNISDRLASLIEQNRVEEEVSRLPLLDTSDLVEHDQKRLAHLLLLSMTGALVWGVRPPRNRLPRQIALPLYRLSEELGLKPVICHGTCCLANWRPKSGEAAAQLERDEFDAREMELIAFDMLGSVGNHWFFLCTAQIEHDFAPAIAAIANCVWKRDSAAQETFQAAATKAYIAIRNSLERATKTLARMRDHLPADEFYHRLRPFLWGYTEGELATSGLIFEGLEHLGPQRHSGASAAQSSTLQTVDAFLAIEHAPDHARFLRTQRQFMPRPHRQFIELVEQSHFQHDSSDGDFQSALLSVRTFRSHHLRIVSTFVVQPASAAAARGPDEPAGVAKGTGGTNFMHFLKAVRDDCSVDQRHPADA